MASAAQIVANRANAKLSTGPVTPEGKAKVATNRLSHGLTGQFRLLSSESQPDYDALLDSLAEEYQPQTATEFHYLNEAARNMWRLQRASVLEEQVFQGTLKLNLVLRYTNSARRAINQAVKYLAAARKAREAVQNEPPVEIGFESHPEKHALPQPSKWCPRLRTPPLPNRAPK